MLMAPSSLPSPMAGAGKGREELPASSLVGSPQQGPARSPRLSRAPAVGARASPPQRRGQPPLQLLDGALVGRRPGPVVLRRARGRWRPAPRGRPAIVGARPAKTLHQGACTRGQGVRNPAHWWGACGAVGHACAYEPPVLLHGCCWPSHQPLPRSANLLLSMLHGAAQRAARCTLRVEDSGEAAMLPPRT